MSEDDDTYKLVWYRKKLAAQWTENGKRRRASFGTDDREVGQRRFAEFKRLRELKTKGAPVTVAAIYTAYVADRKKAGKVSVPRMDDAWKRLAPYFGALMPTHVDEATCDAYIKARRRVKASKGTIHVELGYLRAALTYAFKKQWIDRLPFVRLPQKPPPRHHHLSKEQADKLIEAATTPHVKLFIILALTTAGRMSAILELTWDRIDFKRRKIDLRNPEKDETPKGRAIVPMNRTACHALLEARKTALSDRVIEWGQGGVASVKKGIKSASQRSGVRATAHVLRHTAAVWMAVKRVKLEEIAQYLGHGDVRTTFKVYARYSPEHLKEAGDALELD